MKRYFISYSHDDMNKVENIIDRLDNAGVEIWWDKKIPTGHDWDNEIQEALDYCDELVLFVTESAMNSQNVQDEWSYYRAENKPVIPVMLEDCKVHFRIDRQQRFLSFIDPDCDFNKAIDGLIYRLLRPDEHVPTKPGKDTIPDNQKTNPDALLKSMVFSQLTITIVIIFALLFIIYLLFSQQQQQQDPPTVNFTVRWALGANVYTQPDRTSEVLFTIYQDGQITAYASTGSIDDDPSSPWFLVQQPGNLSRYGWISGGDVHTDLPFNLWHPTDIEDFQDRFDIPYRP